MTYHSRKHARLCERALSWGGGTRGNRRHQKEGAGPSPRENGPRLSALGVSLLVPEYRPHKQTWEAPVKGGQGRPTNFVRNTGYRSITQGLHAARAACHSTVSASCNPAAAGPENRLQGRRPVRRTVASSAAGGPRVDVVWALCGFPVCQCGSFASFWGEASPGRARRRASRLLQ